MPIESSFAAGEIMYERVKVFVLLHELQIFSAGRSLPDRPPILPPADFPEISRAKSAGLNIIGPKLSTELNLVDAVPCRIAFERGKERHFSFLAISMGTSGWIILAEELPQKPRYGTVRVVAPLSGCNPRIDERHLRWLHLRIRPSTLPLSETAKNAANLKLRSKSLVDGRWTLAFKDEASCQSALNMINEEIDFQCNEVERRLKPLISEEM
nr:protein transparent testa 9 isoform X2 [Tanacetum cinerariifolium]